MGEFGTPIPRVIFIGDSGVGKTSIIHRAKYGNFEIHTVPTIGAGTSNMQANFEGKKIDYQLWDTAGQEIYRNIVPIYFKGAVAAVLCFSMTDIESFHSLQSWIDQINSHADAETGITIVGNKIDSDNISVDETDAKKWAETHGYSIFFTSAFTGQSIDLLVEHIETKYVIPSVQTVPISETPIKAEKKPCC